MHQEIDGVDSEVEKYIQYFTSNFREMHTVILNERRFSYDEQPTDEDEKEEIKKITAEQLEKRKFADSVVHRIKKLRDLRSSKPCLQFGVNIALKSLDEDGLAKTIIAYCRYTNDQVGIIITNFGDSSKLVWIDFTPLKNYMSTENGVPRHETTIIKVQNWDESIKDEYHLIYEYLNCPHQFEVSANDTLTFELHIQGNIDSHPEFYGEARNNFVETLDKIHNANHKVASQVYSNYIKHLVEWYHAHRNPDYQIKETKAGQNLVDFHIFVAKDPSVLRIIEEIVENNSMGPIVFVTPELAPWFKIGGLAVMVDELARGFTHLGEDIYVLVPYYHRK